MANKKRSSRRNNHTGGKVAGGAVLLALLLAGGHFGLGIGRAEGGLLTGEALQAAKETVVENAEAAKEVMSEGVEAVKEALTGTAEPTQEPVPVQEIVVAEDDGVLTITVREDTLLYEGREVDLGQLEESLLQDYKADTSTVELQDDHAIKAVYDEVSALLQKLSIPFTEGK
ncbi:MAG: hypothetical protein IKE11_02730 [Clostridia bacterium]|nr:hypothetical protein [Clostridia bacterium]